MALMSGNPQTGTFPCILNPSRGATIIMVKIDIHLNIPYKIDSIFILGVGIFRKIRDKNRHLLGFIPHTFLKNFYEYLYPIQKNIFLF